MTAQVIPFIRFVDVSGWSLQRIRGYMQQQHWRGFILHWGAANEVVIERTTG